MRRAVRLDMMLHVRKKCVFKRNVPGEWIISYDMTTFRTGG